MEIYLVGGAVRDQLLGEEVKERDFVVVKSTPEEMLALGYRQVGKGFPVFLHPKSHEEYALARIERKVGKGYTEFTCIATPDVTLEEDLKRRDLTINAMAVDSNGKLIDPYGGQTDLKNKIIRHVSASFAEDPLRVLRVARFAARFGDFSIHPETMSLMKDIVKAKEIEALVPERIWQELARALQEKHPHRFFLVLKECNALEIICPEILNDFFNNIAVLQKATRLSDQGCVRFASLLYNLNRDAIKNICNRIKAPNRYCQLALLVVNNKNWFTNAETADAETLLQGFQQCDAFRRSERFHQFLLSCESHSKDIPSSAIKRLKLAHQKILGLPIKPLLEQKLSDKALKAAIDMKRIAVLMTLK